MRRVCLVATAVAVIGGIALASCEALRAEFTCVETADCRDGVIAGTCEPTGFCSFSDTSCTGAGRRYGEYAGDGLAGTCVGGGISDGGQDGPDAGEPDGGLANLLPNPGCEDGFAGWDGYQATLTTSTTAHGGTHSCQVCVDPGFTEFTFDDDDMVASVVSQPEAGQVYRASAWVRSSGGPAGQEVSIALREWDDAGSISSRHTFSDPMVLTDVWQHIAVTHTVEADSYALDTLINNAAARASDCFLVDDYEVVRLQ